MVMSDSERAGDGGYEEDGRSRPLATPYLDVDLAWALVELSWALAE